MRIYLFCFFACLFVAAADAQIKLPNVKVGSLKGETVDTHSLLNDSIPVVITFWSTICKPCLQELDALAENWEEWQKELAFKVVAVSTDDARSSSKVRTLVSVNEWPFLVLLDRNQDLKRALNVNAIPHLYVVDAKGTVVYSRIGYTPGSEQKVLAVLKGL